MSTPVGRRDEALVPITILVPVDGSALRERSVPLAQQLAVRFDAEVRTVTVGGDGHGVAADLVLDGGPAGAPLGHLAELDRTLVWMSSPGHGGIRHRLIDSVAEQLIRRAPTPVIVTGPQVGRAEVGVPRTLLAGLADSPRRSKLLQLLAAWAPLLDAKGEFAQVQLALGGRAVRDPHDRPACPGSPRSGSAGASARRRRGARHAPRASRQRPRCGVAEPRRPGGSTGAGRGGLHHRGERVHHDVAYQLIRGSRWPVLATLGT